METNLPPDHLPAQAIGRKARVCDEDHKVRIPHRDHGTLDLHAALQVHRTPRDRRHAHPCLDLIPAPADRNNPAFPRTRVGLDDEHAAIRGLLLIRHPGGHAACAVARDFRHRTVRIEEANPPAPLARPLQKLDAVRADAGIARAQPHRNVPLFVRLHTTVIHDQEVIPAGVRLHERYQSSSQLRKLRTSVMLAILQDLLKMRMLPGRRLHREGCPLQIADRAPLHLGQPPSLAVHRL